MLLMLIELPNKGHDPQASAIAWWMTMDDFWISWIHKKHST